MKKISDAIIYWSNISPDKKLIIDSSNGEFFTYSDLKKFLDIFSTKFYRKRVVLSLPAGIINSAVWLTVIASGGILIPMPEVCSENELLNTINSQKPDIIIYDGIISNKLKEYNSYIWRSKNIFKLFQSSIISHNNRYITDGQVYLTTSGSTGVPKGILLNECQIVYTAKQIIKSHELSSNDICFTPLPFYHVNAPVVGLTSTLISGGTIITAKKFSRSSFWAIAKKFNATWLSIVPTIVAILLEDDTDYSFDIPSIRFVRTASAPLPSINLKRFEERFNIPLIETYGLTEAASTVASNPLYPAKHVASSVGFPIGIDIKIAEVDSKNDALVFIDPLEIGEICIKGENVINAYADGVSNGSFNDGWFRTGDLGHFDSEGYLYITGRKRDVIIKGGENISPREVEEIIYEDPDVKEVCVVGQPDKIYGEKIVAFISLKNIDVNESQFTGKLLKRLEKELSPFKIPSNMFILNEFPKGKTGKVDKNALRNY